MMETSRRRSLGVGVAGVLSLNFVGFGALDFCGDVGSVGGERRQTDVPTVFLPRKGENNVRRKIVEGVDQIQGADTYGGGLLWKKAHTAESGH